MVGFLLISSAVLTGLARGADSGEGFTPIFDGKTLDGWDGNPQFWRVEDGAITGQTTKENPLKVNTFIIWRKGQPADFELRFEFRMVGGNSGVQYRSFEVEKAGKWVCGGYQYDMDAKDQWTGGVYAERDRGIVCVRGQKVVLGDDHKPKLAGAVGDKEELKKLIKKEDWNACSVIAKGFNFVQTLNGRVMCEMTDEDKEMRRKDGIIALQLHVGAPMKVQFRNIRLKIVKGEEAKAEGQK
jgi:hypothetical protein